MPAALKKRGGQERINRNILECKFLPDCLLAPLFLRINRNILECKFIPFPVFCHHLAELIETYWNVNMAMCVMHCHPPVGINRNILEYKFNSIQSAAAFSMELIETYWNVNINLGHILYAYTLELIETYWNVNKS